MNFCINPKSQKITSIAQQLGLPANVIAAKVGHWMSSKNLEDFPTIDDLIKNGQLFSTESKIEEKLVGFLNKLQVDVQEFNELSSITGYDVIGTTDLLNKVVAVVRDRDESVLAKETAYVAYAMLGKKNKIRTSLISSVESMPNYEEIYKSYVAKSPKMYEYKLKELILIDYIADAIHNNYTAPKDSYTNEKSEFWKIDGDTALEKKINYQLVRLKRFINELLEKLRSHYSDNKKLKGTLNTTDFNDLVDDIANDILTNNMQKYQIQLAPDQQLVNYMDTVAKDVVAKGIVENFQKMGLTLTGSLSIRKQGTLYRSTEENLHDLDFTVQYDRLEKDMRWHIEELRRLSVGASRAGQNAIYSAFERTLKDKVKNHTWFKELLQAYPDFQVKQSYTGLNPGDITVTGNIGEHVIDLFINTKPSERLDKNEKGFQDWQNIFKAKIKMGRAKDLLDFANFHPYNSELPTISQDKGFRHFNFGRIETISPEMRPDIEVKANDRCN